MKRRGVFITFEGTDGVGKTTQARLLKQAFEQRGRKVMLTREPGGGPLAEKIRDLLLNPSVKMEHLTELFLYQSARIEHVNKLIRPALQKGWVVLCDRFTDATLAYQGGGRGIPARTIDTLNRMATNGLKPDLTILLDLPVRSGLAKARRVKGHMDRIEKQGLGFQERVRTGYRRLARREPRRIRTIPVQNSAETTQSQIQAIVFRKFP